MNQHSFASRLIDTGMVICLIITLAAAIYGHSGAKESGLILTESYITEYMKQAPRWPWLTAATFSLAISLFWLAAAFLQASNPNLLTCTGSLLLAATAMAHFFVAYAPVRRVQQPAPIHEWWTPAWWFTSQTSRSEYEHGMADAYSDVHYHAIRLVVTFGIASVCSIAAAYWMKDRRRLFSHRSLAVAVLMSVFFLMGDQWNFHRGLWQRIGFALMYCWLWDAWLACRSTRKSSVLKHNQR